MDDILRASATSLARAIAEGRVSSVEVVTSHLDRIQAVNPLLNAVVRVAADEALEAARAADAARARGAQLGPLHGVPMTIKDSFETAGMITSARTDGLRAYVPERDATVVARLRSAGGILLGKTNMPEITLRFSTDNRADRAPALAVASLAEQVFGGWKPPDIQRSSP